MVGTAVLVLSLVTAVAARAATLEEYLARARASHPELAARGARIEAVEADGRRAGALPDLRLAWGEMIVPVETRVGPQQRVFSVSQAFPWPGVRGLRERAVQAGADVERELLRGRTAAVEHAVRTAWSRLALTRTEESIVARHLDLARQDEIARRARYEAGSGRSTNVLAAQMEVAELEVRRRTLLDRIDAEHTALAAAAGHLPEGEAPRAELPPIDDVRLLSRDRLLRLLDRANPDLAARSLREQQQRLNVELAGSSGRPVLSLGLDWIVTGAARMPGTEDSGRDPLIARASVSLPLWGGRAAAEQDAASARLVAAVDDRRGLRLELVSRLDGILQRLDGAQRELRLHEESLLPRMRQRINVAQADLAADRIEWTDLLAERRQLLQLELGSARAAHGLVQARDDLALLLNLTWEEIVSAATAAGEENGS